jgi:malic enzyme
MTPRDKDALDYHAALPAGKIAVHSTKPFLTQRDLSLAYTPGVAAPCLAIERDPNLAYKYTASEKERCAINKYFNIILYTGIPFGVLIICVQSNYFSFVFIEL